MPNNPIFITGIGTDIGKTLIAAILTEALHADYWKPVQAGFADGTDAERVRGLISNNNTVIHPELYKLSTPASPHIAARKENLVIDAGKITEEANRICKSIGEKHLVIEGAGGLLVPLSGDCLVADLVAQLGAGLIIVSRNYLGSINHSLLTAAYCKSRGLKVLGWVFTDDYLHYEDEIVEWSGYPSLGSVPKLEKVNQQTVMEQAHRLRPALMQYLNS